MTSMYLEIISGEALKLFKLPASMNAVINIKLLAIDTSLPADIDLGFEVINGRWKIGVSNKDFLLGNQETDENELQDGHVIKITHLQTETDIAIRCCELDDGFLHYKKYILESGATIGSDRQGTIFVSGDRFKKKHAEIVKRNKDYYINISEGAKVFINDRAVTGERKLRQNDIIYINCVKFLMLSEYIAINNPGGCVKKCRLSPYVKQHVPQKAPKDIFDFDSDYFKRSPRIPKKISEGKETLDPPPTRKEQRFLPFLLQIGSSISMVIVMIVTVMLNSGESSDLRKIISAITIAGSLTGMVLFPRLLRNYQIKRNAADEIERREKYGNYLMNIRTKHSLIQEKNREIYNIIYPNVKVLEKRVLNRERELWERMPQHGDFLETRIGRGTRFYTHQLEFAQEAFSMNEDDLRADAQKLADKFEYIENVPLCVNLMTEYIVGVIGNRKSCIALIQNMILQVAALHCYTEVRMVFIFDEDEAKIWDFARWLPHVWNYERTFRFVGTNVKETTAIFSALEDVFDERRELREKNKKDEIYIPHYVVFGLSGSLMENDIANRRFFKEIENTENLGISFVILQETIDMLHLRSSTIIQCTEARSTVCQIGKTDRMHHFDPDNGQSIDFFELSQKMFDMRVKVTGTATSLPNSLTFLNMYKATRVEELEIKKRWAAAQPFKALDALVGISQNEYFYLNIHEKAHGPHGLIAGMTGSGKSEFIQSYILSLSLNFHPYDVSYILIDFKGGGMANCFKDLPHVAGTITNLGGNQIVRSLISIKSELQRRQRLFEKTGVNHIDKYQQLFKGGDSAATDPLPHLVIISDEFAELKQNQPEFMRELISAARIGRSLGVHLILATQRPSGVVDDQIWSNTRFRVCLKVLDKGDSNDMLKRPEAASLTQAGRAYVQIGSNEVFELIQSGYSGATYNPAVKSEGVETVDLIDNTGIAVISREKPHGDESGAISQLEAVVGHIGEIFAETGDSPLKLWLPQLKDMVLAEEIEPSPRFNGVKWLESAVGLTAAVGLVDDVKNQLQPTLNIDFMRDGHLAIYGITGSGKTTLLQTLMCSLIRNYSPARVHIYILDFASRTMGYFEELPHVGDVVFPDDEQKLKKLFLMLTAQLNARRRLLSESGAGNVRVYMEETGRILPATVVIIHNMAAFNEFYEDKYGEAMSQLMREGVNYGIFFILTTNVTNAIKTKTRQHIKKLLALQLLENYEYINLLGKTEGLVPEKKPGRGLAVLDYAVEFQIALANEEQNDIQRINRLKEEFALMKRAWSGACAPKIPQIPTDFRIADVMNGDFYSQFFKDELLPIGYNLNAIEADCVNPRETGVFAVCGDSRTGKTNFMKMLSLLFSKLSNYQIYIIDDDDRDLRRVSAVSGASYAHEDMEINELCGKLKVLGQKRGGEWSKNPEAVFEPVIVLIDNYANFFKKASEHSVEIVNGLMMKGKKFNISFYVSAASLSQFSGYPIMNLLFSGDGVLLGGNFDSYGRFKVNMPDYKARTAVFDSGTGYRFNNGSYYIIKTPLCPD